MKVSYSWLKEFVAFDLSPRLLAERLTMVGLAVDAVEEHGDDSVLEIDLTSNRPDCLSHLGVAREVAAITGGRLDFAVRVDESADSEASAQVAAVEIANPALCPRYTARVIRDVKIGPSPSWLVKRLEALGQRSVNNVADITNYVMLELGQPLHAFDLNMIRGRRIIVRNAARGERMVTLDGEEREFTEDMLLITDAERALAIGGIKGGEDSGITDATTDVLLEAAYFTPAQIRQTSRVLGLSTEASYRFERGTDPEIVPVASDRAAALMAEIAGGRVLGGLIDVYPNRQPGRSVTMRLARYKAMTGLDMTLDEAGAVLSSLGMQTVTDAAGEKLVAAAPSWRIDIAIEEDLIEEVARIRGYDKLQSTLPGSAGAGAYVEGEAGRRAVRSALTQMGYFEAVSFSFVNAEMDAFFSSGSDDARVKLTNPIDTTQSEMRTTLLSGLLGAVARNLNHGTRNVKLFELGNCFQHSDGGERPDEIERLAIACTGARNENDWQGAVTKLDFYDLKGAVEAVLENLNLPKVNFDRAIGVAYLHPERAAVISSRDEVVGHLGQLNSTLASRLKFKQPIFVAELNLGSLLNTRRVEPRYQALPRFPGVLRDIAIVVSRERSWSEIEASVRDLGIEELEGVRLFDLYAGSELPAGSHSMALSLRFRASDRTLTDSEISALYDRVVNMLRNRFGAELR